MIFELDDLWHWMTFKGQIGNYGSDFEQYVNKFHVDGRRFSVAELHAASKTSSANGSHLNVWGFDISAAEFPQQKKRASLVWIGPKTSVCRSWRGLHITNLRLQGDLQASVRRLHACIEDVLKAGRHNDLRRPWSRTTPKRIHVYLKPTFPRRPTSVCTYRRVLKTFSTTASKTSH